MSVILNKPAIAAFMESLPVADMVERTANRIVAEAQKNVRAYYATAPSLDVDQDIGVEMEGSTGTIGIKDAGSKSRLLARAQAEGRINWLKDALEAARRG